MKTWITEGFESFRRGEFGNGGQNLYVSRKGVLQRIHQFDLNHNGHFDLVFANCQNHHESAESYVYGLDGQRLAALPGQGAVAGLAADLTGDGWTDLVVAGYYDMAAPFATTDIYFGSADGYSENRHIRIPTPFAEDVCCGRFAPGEHPSLAFAMPTYHCVRVFRQEGHGFEWNRFTDIPVEAALLTAADLDGDGCDELVCRPANSSETVVLWGGEGGLAADRKATLPELPPSEIVQPIASSEGRQSELEKRIDTPRLLQKVVWQDKECFTLSTGRDMRFYTSDKERCIKLHFAVDVPMALAVAVGDLDGDGLDDLAFACRDTGSGDGQRSHIYLNRGGCFPAEARLSVRTEEACDVCILDNRVLFGCSSRLERYTNDSLLFELSQGKLSQEPVHFEGEDTRRVAIFRNPDGIVRLFLQNHYSRSALGYDQAYIYWGGKDGYDPARMTPVPCWCGVDSLSADLDDDGWAELLLANNSENSLHLDPGHHIHHFGPNGFEPQKSRTIQTDIGWGVAVADFDRDGYLEIATPCNQWNDLRIFHGRDDFRSWTDIPLAGKGSARWICAVDLNRDGWLELVVPLITTDRTLILWGGPDGFSLERSSELAVNHGVFATAADLNGNGWPDLIIGGHTETPKKGELVPHQPHVSWLNIYWNGPEGLSESRRTMLRADAACSISVADFNGDGFLDIFAGSYHGGIDRDINSFLYWNRQGHFHELDRQLLFTHSASGSIACDFDEDGRVDLAIANHKVDGDHLGYSCVWWNGPHGFNEERTTRLPTCGPHGMCSVNPGNILDRGDEEYYLSEPFQAQEDATVAAIDLTAELPPKTWVTAMIRTSATRDGLSDAAWLPPQGCQIAASSWMQYRLAIGARNSLRTPRVTRVAVRWQLCC